MSVPFTHANTKFFISSRPIRQKKTLVIEDFTGVDWIQVDGLFNLGELGADETFNSIELIDSDWVYKTRATRDGGTMTNTFIPNHLDPGQIAFRAAVENRCGTYGFKVERNADCAPEETVTISVADPAVVTWNNHDFLAGQPIMFSTEGTMPTGLTAGVIYYVLAAGLTEDAFSVSATPGGTPIEVTEAGTGDIIATAPAAGMTDLFLGLPSLGAKSGGGRNDNLTVTMSVGVTGPVLTV